MAGMFLPIWDSSGRGFSVAVKTGTPTAVLPRMLESIAQVDPNLPVRDLATLRETLRAEHGPERVFAALFGAFGSIALALAVVGLYGVVAFGVNQRAREFGVRRALGASSADIQWWTVRSGMLPLAIGLVLGMGIAWLLAPSMVDMLFGTDPHDPRLFAVVPGALAAAAAMGLWAPARRAAQMDPMAVLRSE